MDHTDKQGSAGPQEPFYSSHTYWRNPPLPPLCVALQKLKMMIERQPLLAPTSEQVVSQYKQNHL